MKLEKIKNLVLGLGKGLSIFSIIVTLLIVFLGILSEIFLYNDFFDSIKWLIEFIITCFGICFYCGSVFVLPSLFGLGAILTGIIAFKNRNVKEILDLRFLIILVGILSPLGLFLLSENFSGVFL